MEVYHLRMKAKILLIALLTAAMSCSAAISVSFDKERRYADAGMSGDEAISNVRDLATYIAGVAKRDLPPEADLRVEILDVDLAGDAVHGGEFAGDDILGDQMNGGALRMPGRADVAATDKISGPDYLTHGQSLSYDPMRYEKLMIDEWFRYRIVEGRPAPH